MNCLQTVGNRKTYGLIKKTASTEPKRKVLSSVFSSLEEDDDEITNKPAISDVDRVNKRLREANAKRNAEVEKLYSSALSEDSSIFDYDDAYDRFKEQANEREVLAKVAAPVVKPRYIENLKAVATVREKEKDRIYERRLLKERQAEDQLFPETEKFVTRAYKEKMMEANKWEYEDRLAEELEKKNDVRTKGFESFYSNLLTKNISVSG